MTPDMRVALTTSLNDKLVGPLRRTLDEVEKNLKEIETDLQKVNTTGAKATTTLVNMKGPQQATREAAALARETTHAISLVERLGRAWSTTGNMVKGVAQGVAAFQAARMVVSQPLQNARTYNRQLADASNTAFADRALPGRIAGMRDLDATVTAAMRAGGGKREDMLSALNEMLASGSVNPEQAKNLLPVTARYATAGNANVTELSTIVVRALQNGFKEADIPVMLDKALAAGQAGGFELKDMAKWLPKFLAAAQMSGLTGMGGYERILASAQGSVITAGSKDEAGNNLQNLLLKINSSDTAQDAKKLGIDLSGSLAAARAKGVNSLDAFVNMVDKIAAKDPRLVALRKKASGAGNDEERAASFSAQADILQGSAIGRIVQDRQALMPLIAELNKRDYIKDVQSKLRDAQGQYGDSNFALISGTDDFKVSQQENERLIAQTNGLDSANSAIAKLSEFTTELYQKYPELGKWMENTVLSLKALAAAAATAAAASLLLGGGGLKGVLTRLTSGGAGATPKSAPLSAVGTLGGLVGAGLAAANPLLLIEALTGPSEKDIATLREKDRAASGYRGKGFADPRLLGVGDGADVLQRDTDSNPAGLNYQMRAWINPGRRGKGFADPRLLGVGEGPEALQRQSSGAQAGDAQTLSKLDQAIVELKAVAARPIIVQIDGREVASSTNQHNGVESRRN